MMIKYILFGFLSFIIFSSSVCTVNYYKRLNQLIVAYADILEVQKKFKLSKIGGGMPQDITFFSMSFYVPSQADIGIARKIYIETMEGFKAVVNSDVLIRPVLKQYPFSHEGIKITLFFDDYDKTEKNNQKMISFVHSANGYIYYLEEGNGPISSRILYDEPYETALKIVKDSGNVELSKNYLSTFAQQILSQIPFAPLEKKEWKGPPAEVKMKIEFDKFADKVASDNHMVKLKIGHGGLVDGKKSRWTVHWVSDEKMNLDQAKILASSIYKTMWKEIYDNAVFLSHLKERAIDDSSIKIKIEPQMVGFKINFWDEDVNRPICPYISQIRLADGLFYYYFADPETQALTQPIVQSLESLQKYNGISK